MTDLQTCKPVMRIDLPDKQRLGRGKIELLEHIRDTGSISAAGRRMDMSYRRAWQLVDAINHMFIQTAVEPQRGGNKGGGAVVTPFGEELIQRFRHMEKLMSVSIKSELDWIDAQRASMDNKTINSE